ncbi:MAG TPA: amino acid adenylation domain-containing protein, partial [Pseudonocardiaceae bacterium]
MSAAPNCFVIGGTRVLIRCTARLLEAGMRVEGVLTDDPAAVTWAGEHGIPVLDPRGDLVVALTAASVDYLFSMVNFRILTAEVLALPAVAAINFHDGPLPRYSGSHVPAWALYEGATRHAATWHLMTEAVDAGGVLAERWFPVRGHSTALSLTYEAAEVGIELFDELVPRLMQRALPEPVDTSGRERRFYRRSARMASGGIIHAGTSAVEAERISKALDYGSFPNPLGVPTLVTDQGVVFSRQVRIIPRDDHRADTVAVSVDGSAIKFATPEADLLLSDFGDVEGNTISGRAAAQRLGITVGGPFPPVSAERLAAIAEAQTLLRPHEPWWRRRLSDLRPAPVPAADFSAATAHYGRFELAYVPHSREESVDVVRAFLAALAERMGTTCFDFAWSPAAARELAERTGGIAAARVPVRFDADDTGSLAAKLDEAAARRGYATDLELRLGLAQRPLGHDGPSFTRIMVLERAAGEEAATEPDTEIALLCLAGGPPTVFVRETAMDQDEALAFAERVEDLALGVMLHGEATPVPAVLTEPDVPVTAAPVAAAPEAVAPDLGTVLDLVAAVVAERPDAIAVRCGTHELTYAELDAWADAVAAHLYDHGVDEASVVGVLTERGPELLPAMLGVLRAGAAFLPLDPNYPVERLGRYTEVARCDLVLTDPRTHALGARLAPSALPVPPPDGSLLAIAPEVTAGDLAYVLFTSGSTGEPKGVEIEHGALACFLTGIGERLGTSASDVVLAHTTTAFDISLLELLLPLTVGATVVVASRAVARSPQRLAELIGSTPDAASGITVAQATPSMWRLLLDTGWEPHAGLTVLSGGEALPPATAQRLLGPARELWNLYGPTEATIWVSAHRVESVGAFLPLGDPLPATGFHVLDADLTPCPPGWSGDLYISGAQLARGYAHRPDRTAEVFLTHPASGLRLYRTGDTVRPHEDGRIEWQGRGDAQVKVRGNRIEPAEIERVLEKSPLIGAAVVVAVPFEGRGEPRLTAYLVTHGPVTKGELDALVGRTLPEYMVPDAYVTLDELPLTDNGKIARSRLPQPTRHTIIRTGDTPTPVPAPRPATAEPAVAAEPARPVAPMGEELAAAIARVFATVLGHDELEPGDNFFDLGGDSANVTLAAAALGRELGLEVSPAAIFATGTAAKLAALLRPGATPAPAASRRPAAPAPAAAVTPDVAEILAATPATPAAPADTDVPVAEPVAASASVAPPSTPAEEPAADKAEEAPRWWQADGASDGAPLAIIGMACRFPGAATPDEFWSNLAGGVSSVGAAPDGHRGWGHLWSGADEVPAGWVDGVERFDAARFGLTEREARRLDPLQRILLSVTDEALEGCGHDRDSLGANTGVFVGTIASDFPELVAGSVGHGDPHAATGTAVSMVANRLSHVFDWSGPSFAVDTACSSSLVALHVAAMHLRSGEIDAAVVGAANLVLAPSKTRSFARNGMLSPQGVCRTFDQGADGYVRGEGCGVLLLKRLADAERDGDPVLAVVRGVAVNHTGASAGFLTAPSSTAQEAVIRRAMGASGVSAVGYVEAHGTGTQLGDLIELEALRAALGDGTGPGSVAVGSVKTNIGHLEPAAGIAGLIKTVLALQAGHIPPSLNLSVPNTSFRFEESPLFVADRLVPWDGPRLAGVSSFGFGGVNAHAVLEAAPPPADPGVPGPFLLTLSAGSEEALGTLADRLVRLLRSPHCPPLTWLCAASRRRSAAAHRLACVVDSAEQLDDKLMLFLARVDAARLYVGTAPAGAGPAEPVEPVEPVERLTTDREGLDLAARRFVAGAALPVERPAVGVRFPTAPHDEKHLWLEPVGTHAGGRLTWTKHPEAVEHVVLGTPTLPGSGYPARIAEVLGRDRFAVRDLTFRAAVRPPATLTAQCDGATVMFRDGAGTVVCEARVCDGDPAEGAPVPPAAEDRFTPVDLDDVYAAFERAGLSYGTGFRCLTALAVAPGEALGTVRGVPVAGAGSVDARLLDGAFQVALAACGAEGLYVPLTVERLGVLGPVSGTARVYARRDRAAAPDAGLLTASLVMLDGDRPVLVARGVTWRRLTSRPPAAPEHGTFDGPAVAAPTERNGYLPAPAAPPAGAVAHGANGSANGAGRDGVSPDAAPVPAPSGASGVGAPGGAALGPALARWIAEGLEADVEALELDRPLEEQGLDSMLAISLAQDIRARLDVDIPVTLLLEVGTVDNLVAELRDTYGVTAAPATGEPVPAAPAPVAPVPAVPVASAAVASRVTTADRAGRTDDRDGERGDRHDMAIVGFDGVFPNADDPGELWHVLMNREDCLREVPKSRWNIDAYYSDEALPGTVYLRRAGFVEDMAGFDARFFRISPAEAQWIDPQQRHLVQSAWRALEDAGLSGRVHGRSVGVFVGASYQHYRDMVVGDVVQTAAGLGNHNAILANRVSYFLDLNGPSMTIDTLCSSSLVALHTAVRSIRDGECEQAVVAGVHLGMSPQYFQLGSRLRSFSPTGASRAFDAGADGFVPGEGVVTVVIKPLSAALRDGDRVRGVIRGTAV